MKDMTLTLDHINPLQGETIAERVNNVTSELLKFRVDIEDALRYAYGSYTYDDLVSGVMQGRFVFYTHMHSFAFCEMQKLPQYTIFHIFLVGGNMDELMEMYDILEPYAEQSEAKYASLNGRMGWARALKDKGWKPKYTILYKEV